MPETEEQSTSFSDEIWDIDSLPCAVCQEPLGPWRAVYWDEEECICHLDCKPNIRAVG